MGGAAAFLPRSLAKNPSTAAISSSLKPD